LFGARRSVLRQDSKNKPAPDIKPEAARTAFPFRFLSSGTGKPRVERPPYTIKPPFGNPTVRSALRRDPETTRPSTPQETPWCCGQTSLAASQNILLCPVHTNPRVLADDDAHTRRRFRTDTNQQ